MDEAEQKLRFGFFLRLCNTERLRMAASHWVWTVCDDPGGAPSLREVIAFPKTAAATDLMMDAPPGHGCAVEELSIAVRK